MTFKIMENSLRTYYLQQMGIELWLSRDRQKDALTVANTQLFAHAPQHQTATHSFFLKGNLNARLMMIDGVALSSFEISNDSLRNKADVLLQNMIKCIDLSEKDVFILQVVKSDLSSTHSANSDELKECSDYLFEQIKSIKPVLIFAMGLPATQLLLNKSLESNDAGKKIHHYQGTPIVITYHPMHLVKNSIDKKETYQNLRQIKQFLDEAACEKPLV